MVLRLCAAICGGAILFAYSPSATAKLGTVNVYSGARRITANGQYSGTSTVARHQQAFVTDACATSRGKRRCITAKVDRAVTIVGTASMYDPFQPGYDEGGIETASGEQYDPIAWTAAIQIDLRETFGGVRNGKDYRPAYALIEAAGKRAIIKINDVGPLKPGRVIDFNEQTMRYFDPSLQLGIIHSVKITPLPGDDWAPGPINGGRELINVANR
ncbi:MAG: RlpA-like double-psi beta-barrel domain-containing protein [Hyphomicrobiales bacterium]|jgi:rare lipoprotein A